MLKKVHEITTYNDLLKLLLIFNEEQLNMPIQITNHEDMVLGKNVEMFPGIAIGSMEKFEFCGCRSVTNNEFNADEIVILTDGNPFGEDGAVSYTLDFESKPIKHIPNYSEKFGKTDIKKQLRKKNKKAKKRGTLPPYEYHIVFNRMKKINGDEENG